MVEQSWSSFDGINLHAVLWKPDVPPKAVLAFIHGHGTHCRRYDDWFIAFSKEGFAVLSFDMRGHGSSGGKQGTIHRYNEYLEDTKLLMQKARENFPLLPIILYGHSMGATIALSYLGNKHNLPEMAVIASPWLELVQPLGKFKSLAIWLADSLLPQVTIKTGLKAKDFAPQATNESPRERDPLMHKNMSARCFREVQKATKKIGPDILPATIPMLFMHGAIDKVSDPNATEKLAKSLSEKVTYRKWNDGPHQMHSWNQNHLVTNFTIKWINKML